jgi:hypothetical protein
MDELCHRLCLNCLHLPAHAALVVEESNGHLKMATTIERGIVGT